MRAYELMEAVDTAKITRKAIEILTKAFEDAMRKVGDTIGHDYGVTAEDSESYHRAYDRFYTATSDDPTLLDPYVEQFIGLATTSLTRYIQDHIAAFPEGRHISPEQAAAFGVQIALSDTSKDSLADQTNGYFSMHGTQGFAEDNPEEAGKGVKVFARRGKWRRAIQYGMQQEWFGESEKDGVAIMVRDVLPTFVHEMSHLEVRSRHPGHVRDFTYVRGGTKRAWDSKRMTWVNRKYGGTRGGFTRSPEKGGLERMRYYGSSHELDAFASGAAAAIYQGIKRQAERYSATNPPEVNRLVDSKIQELCQPGSDIASYPQIGNYWNVIRNTLAADQTWHPTDPQDPDSDGEYRDKPPGVRRTWDGERYHDETYNTEDLRKVWNRFLKLVVNKLEQFKSPDLYRPRWAAPNEWGEQPEYRTAFRPNLLAILRDPKHKTPQDQILALAMVAARDAYDGFKNDWRPDPERKIAQLAAGEDVGIWEYTDLVKDWFYNDPHSERAAKAAQSFARLVGKRLEQIVRVARKAGKLPPAEVERAAD